MAANGRLKASRAPPLRPRVGDVKVSAHLAGSHARVGSFHRSIPAFRGLDDRREGAWPGMPRRQRPHREWSRRTGLEADPGNLNAGRKAFVMPGSSRFKISLIDEAYMITRGLTASAASIDSPRVSRETSRPS